MKNVGTQTDELLEPRFTFYHFAAIVWWVDFSVKYEIHADA
jgi:hypothetical protein